LYVLNNVKSIRQLVLPLSLQVGIQAIVAIAQARQQMSVGLQAVGEYLLDPAWNGVSVVFTQTSRSLRAYSVSARPNTVGGCLGFSFILLFACFLFGKEKKRWLALPVIALGAVALFYTYSRSAWLGAGAAGVVMLVLVIRKKDRPATMATLLS